MKYDREITFEQANEVTREMVKRVNMPYHILPQELSIEELMNIYEQTAERGKKDGFTPVLIPSDNYLNEQLYIMWEEQNYSIPKTLEKAKLLDGKAVLECRFKEFAEEDFYGSADELMGKMENGTAINAFSSVINFYNGNTKETVLFEVCTERSWEIPAYIPFGGWNDCPSPKDMTAVCKYWFEKYKAVPAVISHDSMEFIVPESVSAENAMDLAKEHYAFCYDRVCQCTNSYTIGEVADCLRFSKVWYFWWD